LRKISRSLSLKTIGLINAFVIIPAIIISIFVCHNVSNALKAEIVNNLMMVNNEKRDKFDRQLTNLEIEAQTIAFNPYARMYFDGLKRGRAANPDVLRTLGSYLEERVQKSDGVLENLAYYFREVVVADGIGGKSLNVKFDPEATIGLGSIEMSPVSGFPTLVNIIPLNDLSLFVMAVDLVKITEKVIENGQRSQIKSIIVQNDGFVLACENRKQIMKLNLKKAGAAAAKFFAAVTAKGSESGSGILNLKGVPYLAAYTKSPTRDLYMITYAPLSLCNQKPVELALGIVIILIICVIISFLVSAVLAKRMIVQPVQETAGYLAQVAIGNLEVAVPDKYLSRSDEIGKLATAAHRMINDLREKAAAAARIAAGDLQIKLEMKSEQDVLTQNLNKMVANLQGVVGDINMLAAAAVAGNLTTRADAAQHGGEYQKMVVGINGTLDAVVAPVTAAQQSLRKIALNDYTSELQPEHYQGDLRQLAEMVNTVRLRLLDLQDFAQRVSQGDTSRLAELIKIGQRSANDRLAPAFIAMMQNIEDLIGEVDRLTNAAINGDLQTRGDIGQFQGGYQRIITGFNRALEAIIAPVKETSAVLQEMATGNLDVAAAANYQGDHALLTQAINHTLTSFNEVLGEVYNVAGQVANGAKNIAGSSQVMSQTAAEQAATTEEIIASLNQIGAHTKQNAENASSANNLAIAAREQATAGNEQMQKMLEAMTAIHDSSASIVKIIKVIEEIAFQTNILALNAAVEAARAGQYGKGFAVVAEEVRNLAARSANAANETTDLIENSIQKVAAGTQIASETAQSFGKIVAGIVKTTALVGNIATASNEQASGIAQINQGIGQIAQVTQSNTATAEESAAASEELAAQAETLKEMAQRFKLKKRGKRSDAGGYGNAEQQSVKRLLTASPRMNESGDDD
ncbi:MAG: methyl-accepting chemotaxis protein, partial [Bacillota bacterium]